MFRKIKDTPVLKGRNAKRFLKLLSDNKSKKLDNSALEKMKGNYEKLKAIAEF